MNRNHSAAAYIMRGLLHLLLLLPGAAQVSAMDRVSVFVSIPPQRQFVEKIGGEHVDVHVMLPAGQSPETYSPSPRMLASLSGASIYFQIGVPFEVSWTDSIRSANRGIRIARCCDHLVDPGITVPGHDHHDLHIWSSPVYVKALARQIRDELSAVDPDHKASYAVGFQLFIAELEALDASIRNKLSDKRTRHFIVSHAAWGYFAAEYGLDQHALENNGKESGPRTLLELIRFARAEQIHTLFSVKQYRTPVVDSLARELDATIVELDPLAEDYLANMALVSDRIAEALR
jgi:zinc transport system substrate-binding protein